MPRSGAVKLGELARQEGPAHLTTACEPFGPQVGNLVRPRRDQHPTLRHGSVVSYDMKNVTFWLMESAT